MKVVTVIGARPQFIKAAAVSRVIAEHDNVNELLVHTGQHYDSNMSDVFFEELEIPKPRYHLGIGSGAHGLQTGKMLQAIEEVLVKESPDWVLVYGDTNSTLAGAVAAAKLHIPVAHVEAGLRSFNRGMPEEINRVLTDHASELLFAPTQAALENLRDEGLINKAHCVGDVMYDAALYFLEKSRKASTVLETLSLEKKQYALATIHRAENTDHSDRLDAIFKHFANLHEDIPVILPLHPRTKNILRKQNKLEKIKGQIIIIDPVGYLDMVMLESNAKVIITDSGGVQKESFFYGVPCITLRDETEWVELVDLKWNKVVSPLEINDILSEVEDFLSVQRKDANPYGKGESAKLILGLMKQ